MSGTAGPGRRRRLAVVRAAPVVLLMVAWSIGASTRAAPVAAPRAVDIAKFGFEPRDLTVEPGTRVTWTNHDETPHTVTSAAGRKVLTSPGLDTDDRYGFVFTTEGDYPYFCTVHPMMTGVVHVKRSAP